MKVKPFINGEYRETLPDVEGGAPSISAPPVDEGDDSDNDTIPEEVSLWDSLSVDMDDTDEPEIPEDSPTEEATDAPAPEETTPEAPAEPEAEPEAEVTEPEPVAADTATPVEPKAQPTIPEPEPEPLPQRTEAEIQEAVAERTKGLENSLTERFAINQDEALQLVTDPAKAFPKLQARMFADMWLAVEGLIEQKLPAVIESTSRNMRVRDEKVDDFFKAWPKLDRKTHGPQVAQVAAVYSQVNPKATEADVSKYVGMQVMMLNGMTPDMVTNTESVDTTPAETPLAPHRPSAVNSAGSSSLQQSGNLYEAMADELMDDED